MKTITDQQCDAIIQELTRLNVPCQSRDAIKALFEGLPRTDKAVTEK